MSQPRPHPASPDLMALAESAEPFVLLMTSTVQATAPPWESSTVRLAQPATRLVEA